MAGGENRPELFLTNHGDTIPFSSIICPVAVITSATFDRYSPFPPLPNSYHSKYKACFYTSSFSTLPLLDSALTTPFSSSFLTILKLRTHILSRLRSPRNLRFVVSVVSNACHVLKVLRTCGEVVRSDSRCVEVLFKSVSSFQLLDGVFGGLWNVCNYDLKFHQICWMSYRLVSPDQGRLVVHFVVINHGVPGSGLPINRHQLATHDAAKLKVADLQQRVQYCSVLSDSVVASAAAAAEGDEATTSAKRARVLVRKVAKLKQTLQLAVDDVHLCEAALAAMSADAEAENG